MRLKNISILSSALARKRNRKTPMEQQTGAVEKINYTGSIVIQHKILIQD
jgi:hypothetical protein